MLVQSTVSLALHRRVDVSRETQVVANDESILRIADFRSSFESSHAMAGDEILKNSSLRVRACVRAYVRACVRARACMCVSAYE